MDAVRHADTHSQRWAFTTSNAGARDFEDFSSLDDLDRIDWNAVQHRNYRSEDHRGKQAEFLIERSFPWFLVQRICVNLPEIKEQVDGILSGATRKPQVELAPGWYYQ